jgi:hypothetical protein
MPVSVTNTFHANNPPITFAITVAAISTEHFYELYTSPTCSAASGSSIKMFIFNNLTITLVTLVGE